MIRVPMTMTSDAGWQETHLMHTPVDNMLKEAVNAKGQQQKQLIGQMLTWISENQGYICPAFPNWDFPTKSSVRGLEFWVQRGFNWNNVSMA